jgi:hypothetical protein
MANGIAASPRAMASPAPSPALADTPSTPGSARGLRRSPCNAAPARPRAAPTRAASTTRGARMDQRISPGAEPGWVTAFR